MTGATHYKNVTYKLPGSISTLQMEKALQKSMEFTHGVAKVTETDPHGIDAKTPGAKLDSGKPSVGRGCLHYFPNALTAVAELSTIGAQKYSWKGWAEVPDGVHRYTDALARHELRIADDFTRRDPDTNVLEATAVAWNALARLELIIRESK